LEVGGKELFLPLALLGRNENTDLPLDDPRVSQRHAYVQVIEGRLFGADLRSRTGTHWSSASAGAGWVDRNQPISIGPFTVRFEGHSRARDSTHAGDWNPLTAASWDHGAGGQVTLESDRGPNLVLVWRLQSVLNLAGRSPTCAIHLQDPTVSSFHCSFLRTPLGTWAIDLLGRGGISLNGRRVRWGRLDDGDRLQIGKYALRVRHEAQPVAAPTTVPATDVHDEVPVRQSSPLAATVSDIVIGQTEPPVDETALVDATAVEIMLGEPEQAPASNENESSNATAVDKVRLPDATPREARGETPADIESAVEQAPEPEPATPADLRGSLVPIGEQQQLSEAVVMSLFNQFAAMQHQMFDQFQQAIMMMVEMFREMQHDQVGLIREEVDRLHQITVELQALQAELASQRAAPAETPVEPALAPHIVAENGVAAAHEWSSSAESSPDGAELMAAPAQKAPLADREQAEATLPSEAPYQATPVTENVNVTDMASPAAQPTPPLPRGVASPTSKGWPSLNSPPSGTAPRDREVHIWLYEKIEALQRERQSRLQKIMNFLRGK
jgi:pSer/pThr/pTyr-binding forkhead associated (FHA) protein